MPRKCFLVIETFLFLPQDFIFPCKKKFSLATGIFSLLQEKKNVFGEERKNSCGQKKNVLSLRKKILASENIFVSE